MAVSRAKRPSPAPRSAAAKPARRTGETLSIGGRQVPVSHLDLYRVADLRSEDPDLLVDYLGPDRIAFVEWPDNAVATIAGLSRLAARVVIEHAGGDRRVVTIEAR